MSDLAFYDLESKRVVVPQILSHLMRPRGMPLRVIPGCTSTNILAIMSITARLMRRHLPLEQCSMCVPCLQSLLSGSSCCDVAAAIRYSWLLRFVVPPCPKQYASALQGPPLSPRSRAAPTAIAIAVRAVSPRDGQGKIDRVPRGGPRWPSQTRMRDSWVPGFRWRPWGLVDFPSWVLAVVTSCLLVSQGV